MCEIESNVVDGIVFFLCSISTLSNFIKPKKSDKFCWEFLHWKELMLKQIFKFGHLFMQRSFRCDLQTQLLMCISTNFPK